MGKNKLKLVTEILAILVICLVSFVGIYVQKANKVENVVKDYQYTKDLSGYRQIVFEVSDAKEVVDSNGKKIGDTDQYDDDTIETNKYKKTENPVNKEENLNDKSYEISRSILEKRLNLMNVKDYNLSMDKNTGKMYLQVPEDDNTDRIVSNVAEKGTFEIKDSEDGTSYIGSDKIKKVSSLYNTTEDGTTVYLHIVLNKEGSAILKDLSSNEYAKKEEAQENNTTTNETEENKTTENEKDKKEDSKDNSKDNEKTEEKQKEISLSISGNEMIKTSFDEPINDGSIDLTMGKPSTDQEEITELLRSASTVATILNSGEMPITYKITENQYVTTDISDTIIRNTIIVAGVILVLLLVFMIVKYKLRGLLALISYLGFLALYLLVIRYTNVAISISGAMAIGIILIINYILNMKLLSIDSENNKLYKKEYLKFVAKMIPILIISIIFIFIGPVPLSSFGMFAFWGIGLMMIYNILVTKNIVD